MKKISKPFSRSLLHLIIIITAFIWILPTVGLLITSFRPPPDVAASGWWTVFEHPFNFTCYSLENYQRVIDLVGHGKTAEALKEAREYSSDGKGHPIFKDAVKDLEGG